MHIRITLFTIVLWKVIKTILFLRNLIRKRDLQNPYEAIDVEDLIHTAELGRNIAKNIPIAKLGCEECKNDEKYITSNCLHYYKSFELDSIAKKAFKDFKKREKEKYKIYRKKNLN